MIVVYSEERQRFEAITSFFERNIPKAERWRWDAGIKRWWAPSEDIARRLSSYAQGGAALRLVNLSDAERDAMRASLAHDSDMEIPAPPGLDYLPYQRAGIAYALRTPRQGEEGGQSLSRGTLIADEMGL